MRPCIFGPARLGPVLLKYEFCFAAPLGLRRRVLVSYLLHLRKKIALNHSVRVVYCIRVLVGGGAKCGFVATPLPIALMQTEIVTVGSRLLRVRRETVLGISFRGAPAFAKTREF